MPADKPTELSRIKLKTWTRQPVPMISKHSVHLTPITFGIRTWLWRYTYLLLLISILWHRRAIFESKEDKLSSSAECRIWTHIYICIYILRNKPLRNFLQCWVGYICHQSISSWIPLHFLDDDISAVMGITHVLNVLLKVLLAYRDLYNNSLVPSG